MADRHSDKDKGELNVLENPLDELSREEADAVKANPAPLDVLMSAKFWKGLMSALGRNWRILLALALLVFSHKYAVEFWTAQWSKDQSYYSHGPMVPLIAAFILWANRERIAASAIKPTWLGLALMILAIPFYIFGHWTGSAALLGVTFFMFLIGATLLFFGIKGSRFVIFPLLYLVFMVPLPATLLDQATFKVQMQSTTVAAKMLRLTGYDVLQDGQTIKNKDGMLDPLPGPLLVGEACSGFRLLISLLTFTAFFVYMVQTPGWKKAILVGAAMPLSLFINSLRITMIGYAGIWTGSAESMHSFHDWSGYLGLVICFVILFGIARLIKANQFVMSFASTEKAVPLKKPIGSSWQGYTAIAVLALMLTAQLAIKPLDATAMGTLNRKDIPKNFETWSSTELPIEKRVREALYTADLFQRLYVDSDSGRPVMLWAEAARDTTSFHDPHSCLPGGGAPITQDKEITIKLRSPRPITIKATMLEASGENGTSYVIHWYMIGDKSYPSTPAIHRQVRVDQVYSFLRQLAHPFGRHAVKNEQYYWYRFSTDDWTGDSKSDVEALKKFIVECLAHSKNMGQIEERRGS